MRVFRQQIAFVAALSAAILWTAVGTGSAEELMSQRLSALMDQNRSAISDINPEQLASLAATPRVATRPTAESDVYSRAYLDSLPDASGDQQWHCLAEAIYFEARGEEIQGMFAVGEVILNRVSSGSFPGTICRVVNQGTGARYACQFSYTCDGQSDAIHERDAWALVGKIARLLIDGQATDLVHGATYYHANTVTPSWARRFEKVASIGNHYFYAEPVRTASN